MIAFCILSILFSFSVSSVISGAAVSLSAVVNGAHVERLALNCNLWKAIELLREPVFDFAPRGVILRLPRHWGSLIPGNTGENPGRPRRCDRERNRESHCLCSREGEKARE